MPTVYRHRLLLPLVLVTVAGWAAKYCAPSDASWLSRYAAGVFYEMFWVLVVMLVCPRCPVVRAAGAVFLITCVLEMLQLWHPPFLENIRATILGRALLGMDFDWWDFPYYLAGCLAGVFIVRVLEGKAPPRRKG